VEQAKVIQCVKERLERMGYKVDALPDGYGAGVDIFARKNGEKFFVEAAGESQTRRGDQDILICIGEIVKRIEERGFEIHYGIAIPESLSQFIRNLGIGGLQALELYLFIVYEYGLVYCLNPQKTVEYVRRLRAGEPIYISLMDVDYKPPEG